MNGMEIKKGRFTLKHEFRVGIWGSLQDSLELIEEMPDGSRVVRPFYGKIKVIDKPKEYNDDTQDYTRQDLEEMLNEQIEKLGTTPSTPRKGVI